MNFQFLTYFIQDFIHTIKNYPKAYPFILQNRLWNGLFNYNWLSKMLTILGIILSLYFYSYMDNWWESEQMAVGFSMGKLGDFVGDTFTEATHLFSSSSFRYVILILLEVFIFHFARKTILVLSGEIADATFKDFISAQKRMVKVVIFSFVMELIFSILIGTAVYLVGLEIIKPFVIFLIQCFFIGFAVLDNYNEIFYKSINASFQFTKRYAGVAIGVGILVYFLMLIPLFGAILGSILGAVIAAITMFEISKKENSQEFQLN